MAAGLFETADFGQEKAEIVVGIDKVGRAADDLPKLGDRQLGLADLGEEVGEVVARLRLVRIEL